MSVKEALVGTWKLLVTSEADGVVGGGGLTASATPPYGRLVAQYQVRLRVRLRVRIRVGVRDSVRAQHPPAPAADARCAHPRHYSVAGRSPIR